MTLKMTSAQVVETSVIVNNNSSFQNYTNPDDHTQQAKKVCAGTRVFLESFQQFPYRNEFCCCVSLSPSTFYKEIMC